MLFGGHLGVKNITLSPKNGAIFSINRELSNIYRGLTPVPTSLFLGFSNAQAATIGKIFTISINN